MGVTRAALSLKAGLPTEPSGKDMERWNRDRGNIAVVFMLCSAKS